jgi:hypothetical protein
MGYQGIGCPCGISADLNGKRVQVQERAFSPRYAPRCSDDAPCMVKRILFARCSNDGQSTWTIEGKDFKWPSSG